MPCVLLLSFSLSPALSLSPADVSIMKQAIPLGGGRVGGGGGLTDASRVGIQENPSCNIIVHRRASSIPFHRNFMYICMYVCIYLCIDVFPPPLPVVRNELSRVRGIPVVLVNK